MKPLKYFAIFLFLGSFFTSCFNDNDDVIRPATQLEIKNFVRRGMNARYLYKPDVPDLANNRFTSNSEYIDFLNGFSSPEELFQALRSKEIDPASGKMIDDFSWIVNDYIALEQSFNGITLNNGMEFGLVSFTDDPDPKIFGYVRYVLPGTDAEIKGIQRGMIFNTIDGQEITVNNRRSLLSPDTYTIGLATYDGNSVTATGESISLTKRQYTENPVFTSKILDVGGSPVGYIMYNQFNDAFDPQLNAVFGQFVAGGVTDLILDVRYNPGGNTETAKDLASMITGQFAGQIFTTEEWNPEIQQFYLTNNPEFIINRFDNQIVGGTLINSLNLSRLYILTTNGSASASELIINALDPYIDVIQVGTTTRGKFQASTTIYDSDDLRRTGKNLNLGHRYAMQPLVLKTINSVGFTDYFGGFDPEIRIAEDFTNLGVLGDENEPLLKAAIDDILGNRSKANYNTKELKSFGDSNMFNIDYEMMYKKDITIPFN
ncbi:S41 family peptidase [Aquimarina sp. MMG016]|uniref:S41 family peptidase n=1 Tax=Aquimarina sp. MMG016 TaxID=2822690 RepID=UPI001B39F18F|nr:S41 family peptidase [Aquimarina sp. MMG016]MBQ4821745.1 peptidase S41 [Aquimarina sp. MMG016]